MDAGDATGESVSGIKDRRIAFGELGAKREQF